MKLTAVKGKNFRNYIRISDLESIDLEYLKYLENVVSRTEYKPFARGFNKHVSENYLINKTFIPAQFQQDIIKNFFPIYPKKIKIENSDIFVNIELNREDFEDFCQNINLPEKFDIYAEKYIYQKESVWNALLFKTSRIEIGTGGGKTLITYMFCKYLVEKFLQENRKILIIVPRVDLVKQTKANFDEFQEYQDTKLRVETIFSGSKRMLDAQIVIGTWQSLKDYDEDYFEEFSVLIGDEAHSAKAYSIRVDIYNKCKNVEYVFGMTGTYPDYNKIDYLNIVAMFGPMVYVKKTKELIEDGNVCPVLINKIDIKYIEDKDFSKNLILSGITGGEKYRVEKKFFQNNPERLKLIAKLCMGFEYNHLILVETVEYVHKLKDFLTEYCGDKRHIDVIYGDVKNREEIKETMKNRHDMILIATYETMSTGVSINNIMHVHFPDGGRSEIRIKQSVGRGLRLHALKEFLNVFDYQDDMQRSSFKNHANDRNIIYTKEGHPTKSFTVKI